MLKSFLWVSFELVFLIISVEYQNLLQGHLINLLAHVQLMKMNCHQHNFQYQNLTNKNPSSTKQIPSLALTSDTTKTRQTLTISHKNQHKPKNSNKVEKSFTASKVKILNPAKPRNAGKPNLFSMSISLESCKIY